MGINFPPILDEHFAVNTSKQQRIPMKDLLKLLNSRIFEHLEKIEREYNEWGVNLKLKWRQLRSKSEKRV